MADHNRRATEWTVTQVVGLVPEFSVPSFGCGAIKPKIGHVFKFGEAAAAHHFIQDRKNNGKVLLAP